MTCLVKTADLASCFWLIMMILNGRIKEAAMDHGHINNFRIIIDREKLMRLKTCKACNRPFNLGDPVVLACGAWEGPPRLIHENEAVLDTASGGYVERKCYQARLGKA